MSQSVASVEAVAGTGNPTATPAPMAITLTGYTSHAVGNVSNTDNLLVAIAKLEARIAVLEAA